MPANSPGFSSIQQNFQRWIGLLAKENAIAFHKLFSKDFIKAKSVGCNRLANLKTGRKKRWIEKRHPIYKRDLSRRPSYLGWLPEERA